MKNRYIVLMLVAVFYLFIGGNKGCGGSGTLEEAIPTGEIAEQNTATPQGLTAQSEEAIPVDAATAAATTAAAGPAKVVCNSEPPPPDVRIAPSCVDFMPKDGDVRMVIDKDRLDSAVVEKLGLTSRINNSWDLTGLLKERADIAGNLVTLCAVCNLRDKPAATQNQSSGNVATATSATGEMVLSNTQSQLNTATFGGSVLSTSSNNNVPSGMTVSTSGQAQQSSNTIDYSQKIADSCKDFVAIYGAKTPVDIRTIFKDKPADENGFYPAGHDWMAWQSSDQKFIVIGTKEMLKTTKDTFAAPLADAQNKFASVAPAGILIDESAKAISYGVKVIVDIEKILSLPFQVMKFEKDVTMISGMDIKADSVGVGASVMKDNKALAKEYLEMSVDDAMKLVKKDKDNVAGNISAGVQFKTADEISKEYTIVNKDNQEIKTQVETKVETNQNQ